MKLNRFTVYTVSLMLLGLAWVCGAQAMQTDNKSPAKEEIGPAQKHPSKNLGITLKAALPNGKEILFIPSHHRTPLGTFPSSYKDEVFKRTALIVEHVPEQGPVETLKRLTDIEYLRKVNGMRGLSDPAWSLEDLGLNIKTKYEYAFAVMENLLKNNTPNKQAPSHLLNIYTMKPGVVFSLYSKFTSYNDKSKKNGMDDEIISSFYLQKKLVTPIEKLDELIDSLPLASAARDDIIDDFKEDNVDEAYPQSLEMMHKFFISNSKKKRLMAFIPTSGFNSLSKRNINWIGRYEDILSKNNSKDFAAIHGLSHFFGENGLINLGQCKDWKWSIFDEGGFYIPFTYYPHKECLFEYEITSKKNLSSLLVQS